MHRPPESDPEATMPPVPSEDTRPAVPAPPDFLKKAAEEGVEEGSAAPEEETAEELIERVQKEDERFTQEAEKALSVALHAGVHVMDFRSLGPEGLFGVEYEITGKGIAGSARVIKKDDGAVEVLPV